MSILDNITIGDENRIDSSVTGQGIIYPVLSINKITKYRI